MSKFKIFLSTSLVGGILVWLSSYVLTVSSYKICGDENIRWCSNNLEQIGLTALSVSLFLTFLTVFLALRYDPQARSLIFHKWKQLAKPFVPILMLFASVAVYEASEPCSMFCGIFLVLFLAILTFCTVVMMSVCWAWLFKANPGWEIILPLVMGLGVLVWSGNMLMDKYEPFKARDTYRAEQKERHNRDIWSKITNYGYVQESYTYDDLELCKELIGESEMQECIDTVTYMVEYPRRTIESSVSNCIESERCVQQLAESWKKTFPNVDVDAIIENYRQLQAQPSTSSTPPGS